MVPSGKLQVLIPVQSYVLVEPPNINEDYGTESQASERAYKAQLGIHKALDAMSNGSWWSQPQIHCSTVYNERLRLVPRQYSHSSNTLSFLKCLK